MKMITTCISKVKKVSALLLLAAVLPTASAGCAGPAWQGWSGFASYDGMLYLGSMSGEVIALNVLARSEESDFPAEGEWRVTAVKAPIPSGGMCGPMGCAPVAPPVIIYTTPAVTDDLVYVATYAGDDGKVMAINRLAPGYDEEGNPSWRKGEWVYPQAQNKFIGAVVGSPVVAGDTVYVGSSDGKVYALDAVYGEERWEFDTGGKIWTSPVVKDGVVYVSNYNHKFFALDSVDGSPIWEVELPAAVASSPAIAGGNLVFGTFDNHFYAVSTDNGKTKWTFSGGNWFWATPVVRDNVIYAGCLDGKVYALEAGHGGKLWEFSADSPIISAPVLLNGFLVVASKSGELYILETGSGDSIKTISIGASVMAPLYGEDNMVYVHARNRCVYGVDIQKGEKVWEFCYSEIE